MNIEIRKNDLLNLIGRDLSDEELEEVLFLIKIELESDEDGVLLLDMNPDRPDLFSAEGIARTIRGFLEIETGLPTLDIKPSGHECIVDPSIKEIRPYIAVGIGKGIELSNELIIDWMQLQEKLTYTIGRDRKKMSIGLYVYDDINFPLHYAAVEPEKISFVPLNETREMDANTILQEHPKGQQYAKLVKNFKKYPLFFDDKKNILSFPPIINSNDLGQVKEHHKNVLIEVTGTDHRSVNQALTIFLWAMADRGASIESLEIKYPDHTETTPDLKNIEIPFTIDYARELAGLSKLTKNEIKKYLSKMRIGLRTSGKNLIAIIPPYRTDFLHKIDVVEDIAIGYGYNRLTPTMPVSMTVGKRSPMSKLVNKLRDLCAVLGYIEVMNFFMSNPEILVDKMGLKASTNQPLMVSNPKTLAYTSVRNSLTPVLLQTLSENAHQEFPHRIFELERVVLPDNKNENLVRIPYHLCLAYSDVTVNLTAFYQDLIWLLTKLDLKPEIKELENDYYIKGRAISIIVDSKVIGSFGEIHPQILENFRITMPTAVFEIEILPEWIKGLPLYQ